MGKGLRNIKISFDDPTLTHYGGMFLFQQFCRKLDIKRMLQRQIRWDRGSLRYHPAELILAMIYTMVAGMKRISSTRILRYNGYFQSLLGLKGFPSVSTLREFLKSISPQELEGLIRVHDSLRERIWEFRGSPSSLIFDFDSTVLPVFGWQIEEAKVGYNPKEPGRPSYHPLICFEGHTRDCWCGLLRAGDTHPVSGARHLLMSCQDRIPKYLYRIRIRGDSGFYDHKFIEPLDEQGIGYAIVAKMTKPIQQKVQHLRYHTFRQAGWQVAQFHYQPQNWLKPHRFCVLRRPKPGMQEPQEQLTLWEHREYFYHVFVTNLDLSSQYIWHFYKPRARCELDIRELKESFPLGSIPTNGFLANQVHFHLILLAYNLVNWFKQICLPEPWNSSTLQTIRTELFATSARLIRSGSKRNRLKFPLGYPHQGMLLQAIKKVNRFHC